MCYSFYCAYNYIFIFQLKSKFFHYAICAFFGVFVLCFFETAAYQGSSVSQVVFIMMASSTITGFIFTAILKKRFLSIKDILVLVLAIIGLICISGNLAVV